MSAIGTKQTLLFAVIPILGASFHLPRTFSHMKSTFKKFPSASDPWLSGVTFRFQSRCVELNPLNIEGRRVSDCSRAPPSLSTLRRSQPYLSPSGSRRKCGRVNGVELIPSKSPLPNILSILSLCSPCRSWLSERRPGPGRDGQERNHQCNPAYHKFIYSTQNISDSLVSIVSGIGGKADMVTAVRNVRL